MGRKGKLLFRKIFKKKSGIENRIPGRSKVLNYAGKKNEGDLVIATEFINLRVEQGRFPFNKNSGLKFPKLHVLNGTVHSGCTDPTQATARFVIVASTDN